MAALSPAASNSSVDGHLKASSSIRRSDSASKTLRGLNKPRCIQCGNVARSRCPYQSCKNCCSKAQNPCHIHVLKSNATFQETTPTSGSPVFDQQSNEPSSSGASLRAIRQVSSNFAQFNCMQSPLRSRKPLTRKDAASINEWRFSKLKEFRDREIEVENESFERYLQNINLLEEVFSVKSEDRATIMDVDPGCKEETLDSENSEMKLKLCLSQMDVNYCRKKVKKIVDQGLKELKKCDRLSDSINGVRDQSEHSKRPIWWQVEKASALSDLTDKLNKARNEEDLKSCLELKFELFSKPTGFNKVETEDVQLSKEPATNDHVPSGKNLDYSMPKLFSTNELDQPALYIIDTHFSSLEQIEDL